MEEKTENTVVNTYQERKAKELSWYYTTGDEEGSTKTSQIYLTMRYI